MERKKNFGGQNISNVIILVLVLVIITSIYFLFFQKDPGNTEAAYNSAKQKAYDRYFQIAFEREEKKNHVSNYGLINIEDVHEVSKLEVLKVSGTEFVTENAADNDQNITSWIQVKGIGIFTVNLAMGEFIADSSRGYVLVRVPKPVLTECKVTETGQLLWKNDWMNDKIGDGVRLSQAQLSEGRRRLEVSMKSSGRFNNAARKSAERNIQLLVQQWNPQNPDLQVKVEFVGQD